MKSRAIHPGILLLILSAIFSCDYLGGEDTVRPVLARTDYYSLRGSTVIVDVAPLAGQSFSSVSLTVTTSPSKGRLTPVDDLLFKYEPDPKFQSGEDHFVITAKNEGNILAENTIKVHMKTLASDFPCDLIPVEDKIKFSREMSTSIPVLENDWLCKTDKTNLTISVHSQPMHGQATVEGESIKYTANPSFQGHDSFIYELKTLGGDVLYGLVSLTDREMEPPVNVYVAGSEFNGTTSIARIWKNGQLQFLPDGTITNDLAVSGDDVYVAGYETQGTTEVARLWKNGVPQDLTDGTRKADAKSVAVSGNDVYVAGYEYNETTSVARLWKNGVSQDLSDGALDAVANDLAISGNDVYVAGYKFNGTTYTAVLWKNGIAQDLTDGTQYSLTFSVAVSGDDVYVAGYEYDGTTYTAKLWKNGVSHDLTVDTQDAIAFSVAVSGNDVYVAGYEFDMTTGENRNRYAKLWKNGVPQTFTAGNQDAVAFSVAVSGDDVYVVGQFNETTARLWKNGVLQSFIDDAQNTSAFSVVVK